MEQMLTVINQQMEMLIQMNATLTEIKMEQDSNRPNMGIQQTTILELHKNVAKLQGELRHANGKLAVFRTSEAAVPARRRQRSKCETETTSTNIPEGN